MNPTPSTTAAPPIPPATMPAGRGLYRRLLGYSRPYWTGFVLAIICMAITAATESVFPALMKELLDNGFSGRSTYDLWVVPATIMGIFVVRGVSGFGGTYALAWLANNVLRDLRREMFSRLVSLPTATFDSQSSGLLISKIVVEVNSVMGAASSVVATLVRDTLILCGLIAWLLYLNWQLTLVVIVMVPAAALITRYFSKRIRQVSRRQLTMTGEMTRTVEEAIAGHRVIKIFGGQDYERERFDEVNRQWRGQAMRMVVAQATQTPLSQMVGAVAVAVVVTIGMYQSMNQQTTVGGFVSFVTAMLMMLGPLKHLADVNGPLQRGLAASEAVFSLIDLPGERDEGTVRIERARGELRFEQVTFCYPGQERAALSAIDLQVAAGETIALVGGSGGGKTTLASLVPRFYSPTEGRILLDGIPIETVRLASLRAQMALVSQDIVLFNDTIAANVAYGADIEPDEASIRAALKAAHLDEWIGSLPEGLNTMVGDRGVRLSGGQRQRVAIARAVLKNAPILILDEATSALDSETERHVQAALDALRKGRTTLVIAHRLSTIEHADRIVVLDGGRIAEMGTHADLVSRDGLYARLHRIQFAGGSETGSSVSS